jgi:NTE family protein
LLREHLHFDGIPRSLYKTHLHAIGISATCYGDADSVTFFAAEPGAEPWKRVYRKGVRATLTLDHLMASLAIPFLFRPVLLNDAYYGDGAMRQTSPLSPAILLGATRLLIIGVNDPVPTGALPLRPPIEPTFSQMFGFMLDSLFMDTMNASLERVNRYNESADMRPIDTLVIMPTRDVNEVARRHVVELPRALRTLLRALGAHNSPNSLLLSYLLFERGFTREMIEMGYEDAKARSAEIRDFLQLESARQFRAAQRF